MGRSFGEEPEAEGFMITNESVNQAIDYILRHMEEDVTLDDVAEYCQPPVQGADRGKRICVYQAAASGTERVPFKDGAGAQDHGDRGGLWLQLVQFQLRIPSALPHGSGCFSEKMPQIFHRAPVFPS